MTTDDATKILEPKEASMDGPPAPAAFPHWESHLIQKTGLNKDELRAVRQEQLREGVHFILHKKRVCYSAEGLQALDAAVRGPVPQQTPAATQSATTEHPDPLAAEVTLVVFRPAKANLHIIEAHLPDRDPANVNNRVRVRVRNNINFVKGMQIPARELHDGFYELTRACPRSRGRW